MKPKSLLPHVPAVAAGLAAGVLLPPGTLVLGFGVFAALALFVLVVEA